MRRCRVKSKELETLAEIYKPGAKFVKEGNFGDKTIITLNHKLCGYCSIPENYLERVGPLYRATPIVFFLSDGTKKYAVCAKSGFGLEHPYIDYLTSYEE